MTHELVYTSALRGVRPGTTGYCTVAHTAGLPVDLQEQLEGLSRFRHRAVGADPDRSGTPIAYAHTLLSVGYQTYHVLSRVADTGLDHTGRSNYLAHHIAFGPDKLLPAGPAWLCEQPRVFETAWDRPPEVLSAPRGLPTGSAGPRKCKRWERATGDAGWAGVLAAATTPAEPAFLVFKPGTDVLGLLTEAMALLPPETRWDVTFNTYFTGGTAGTGCQWRCVLADSPEARDAIASRRGVVLRLDRAMTGEPTGPLVEAARTGVVAAPTRRPVPAVAGFDPVPSARKPRYPRLTTEPPPGEDEKAVEEPLAPASHPRAAGSGLRPLLVGMVLGVMLLLVCGSLVEVSSGRSLLRHAGLKGRDEDEKEKEMARLTADLKAKEDEGQSKDVEFTKLRDDRVKLAQSATDSNRDRVKAEGDRETARQEARNAERKLEEALRDAGKHDGDKKLSKERDDLKRELEQVKRDLDDLRVQPPVIGLNHLAFQKLPDGVELFRTGNREGKGLQKIEVLGLPEGIIANPKEDSTVTVTDKQNQFKAELTVSKKGVVTLHGDTLDLHPLLGMAVVRVSMGDNQPPMYRQLFREKDRPGEIKVIKDTNGKMVFDWMDKLDPPVKQEVQKLAKEKNKGGLVFGRTARVRIGGNEYDLEPPSDKAGQQIELHHRSVEGKGVSVIMKLNDDGFIEINCPPPAATCHILSLKVLRPIKDLPGYSQELLRVR
ncbi:MAG: hypothetical protein JWO38_5147 [Gemmataceae bacterium]|nr:hypothetical protein [Gemmataceae bacterium]